MKTPQENQPIDIVILWVDGSDAAWRNKRERYLNKNIESSDAYGEERFFDFETLKYLLRSIELYTPWVHKVFLITDEQTPEWLETECKRLVVKSHTDFFKNPNHLPTFNSSAIQMNIHHVPELSEQFILMDDDFLFVKEHSPEDFFRKGLPKKNSRHLWLPSKNFPDLWYEMKYYNTQLVKQHKDRTLFKRSFLSKLLGAMYPFYLPIINGVYFLKYIKLRLLKQRPYLEYRGSEHGPMPFLKSINTALEKEFSDEFSKTSSHKFRKGDDLTAFFFDQCYIAMGCFFAGAGKVQVKNLKLDSIDETLIQLKDVFLRQENLSVCIQDSTEGYSQEDRLKIKHSLEMVLDEVFPQKSLFEK
jgi:hypothetical protein